jgi:hypothetical protein
MSVTLPAQPVTADVILPPPLPIIVDVILPPPLLVPTPHQPRRYL